MPSRRKQRKPRASTFTTSPLDIFFANYEFFDYDTTNSASHEFYRLCDEFGWDRDGSEREAAHQDFKDALVKQFNEAYGTDEEDLENWQNLCYIVQIDPIPGDLDACREGIRRTFVNLVDLVDANTTGEGVQVFKSEVELSRYTKSTGKFFPKENAYAGGLLRYLLRHILHPATEIHSRGGIKKRR